jgi:hypothetical protein
MKEAVTRWYYSVPRLGRTRGGQRRGRWPKTEAATKTWGKEVVAEGKKEGDNRDGEG